MPTLILFALLSLVLLVACDQQDPVQAPPADPPADSLQAVLDAKKAQWAEGATDEAKTLYDDGIAKVAATGVIDTMKRVGQAAPPFTLPDATGKEVALASLLERGPVIVVFYRGAWCPYCNLTLAAWQQQLDTIQSLGAQLVAVSPQLPDYSLTSQQKNGLAFPVLSDVGNTVSDAFGITTQVTPEIVKLWEGRIDLEAHNGDASAKLPLPATFLIDRGGTIRFAHAHADYRVRAEPEEVVRALEALQGE